MGVLRLDAWVLAGLACGWDNLYKPNRQILCKQKSYNTKLIHLSLLPSFLDIPVLQPWRRGRLGHANPATRCKTSTKLDGDSALWRIFQNFKSNKTGQSRSHETSDTNKLFFHISLLTTKHLQEFSLFPGLQTYKPPKKNNGVQWVNILYPFRWLKMTICLMNR